MSPMSLSRAAEILEQTAEAMRDPCSNTEDGDFSCEDCPAGREVCVREHAEVVEAAKVVRAATANALLSERGERSACSNGGYCDFDPPCAAECRRAGIDTLEGHKARHIALHKALDELFADYIRHHPDQHEFLAMPLKTLLQWSHEQTVTPTETT